MTNAGLKSTTGVSAPPYKEGTYEWDRPVTFSAAVTFTATLTFGDAATDALTINGYIVYGASTADYLIDMNLATAAVADIRLGDGGTIANSSNTITITDTYLDLALTTALRFTSGVNVDGALVFRDNITMGRAGAEVSFTLLGYLVLSGTADYPINLDGSTANTADIYLTNGGLINNTVNGTLKFSTTASGYIAISEGTTTVKTGYLDLELVTALRFTSGVNVDGALVFRDNIVVGRSAAEVSQILYGYFFIQGTADYGVRLSGSSTVVYGFDIGCSATTAGLNFAVAQLNCIKSVFNISSQLGQYVQGIKMEHTRNADIQPSTGGWWGAQIVLNAGTGYTALDQTAYVLHCVFKGDATDPNTDTVNVIRAETQSNGKVEDLLFVSANDGSTVTGDVARFVAHVAPTRAILALQNGTTGSTPAALYIDVDETMTTGIVFDTGAAITNLLSVTAAANTSYFLIADAEAGCFPNYSSAGSAIANIKIKIGSTDGYVKVYDTA